MDITTADHPAAPSTNTIQDIGGMMEGLATVSTTVMEVPTTTGTVIQTGPVTTVQILSWETAILVRKNASNFKTVADC